HPGDALAAQLRSEDPVAADGSLNGLAANSKRFRNEGWGVPGGRRRALRRACRRRGAHGAACGRARLLADVDALVRCIVARDIAELATDALRRVDARDDAEVEIQIAPVVDVRQGAAAELLDARVAAFVHPSGQAVAQILDHAESIVHGCRADLHGATAE